MNTNSHLLLGLQKCGILELWRMTRTTDTRNRPSHECWKHPLKHLWNSNSLCCNWQHLFHSEFELFSYKYGYVLPFNAEQCFDFCLIFMRVDRIWYRNSLSCNRFRGAQYRKCFSMLRWLNAHSHCTQLKAKLNQPVIYSSHCLFRKANNSLKNHSPMYETVRIISTHTIMPFELQ